MLYPLVETFGASTENTGMSKHARAYTQEPDPRLNELASPEEMADRRKLLTELRALWKRPMTEEEQEFWKKFDEDLERDR